MHADSALDVERVRALDLWIDRLPRHEIMRRIDSACRSREPLQIATVSVHFVTLARHDAHFRRTINRSNLSVADGRLLLWMTQLSGRGASEQITGHDLLNDCLALAAKRGYRVFLLGASPGVAHQLAHALRSRYPGIEVEGHDGGTFERDGSNPNQSAIVQQIRAFEPHLLFVALGAPAQEQWIASHVSQIGGVAIGVGGVFDTQVGRLTRAPRWMQVAGLESLFQLIVAPRRYARRYLVEDPPTLIRLIVDALIQRVSSRRSAAHTPST